MKKLAQTTNRFKLRLPRWATKKRAKIDGDRTRSMVVDVIRPRLFHGAPALGAALRGTRTPSEHFEHHNRFRVGLVLAVSHTSWPHERLSDHCNGLRGDTLTERTNSMLMAQRPHYALLAS